MKHISILFLALAVHTGIYAQDDKVFVHDNNAIPRNINATFTGITVSNTIDLYLSQSDEETVVVSAADIKYRDRIVTEVKDGKLNIYFDGNGFNWNTGDRKLRAYVSFKNISNLSASGSSDIYANGVIKVESLHLTLSGSSDFKGAVDVRELSLNQSGSSDSQISGRADKINVNVSGASDVKGYELITDYCEVIASGSSDIQLTANKEINVNASGSCDVYFKGNAVVNNIRSSGSSSVQRKD